MKKPYRQDPPFCVQIELVEGCNLRCHFCGLNGIRGKKHEYKYMTIKTAHTIAKAIRDAKWNCRIEFAMHGEPTMHHDWMSLIYAFRKVLPSHYMMMESNGTGFCQSGDIIGTIYQAFNHGLSCVALDEYEKVKFVPDIKAALREDCAQGRFLTLTHGMENDLGIRIHEYPGDVRGNPHQRIPGRRLVFISPITQNLTGTHAILTNHCGSGAPQNNSAEGKRCAKPFREMGFRWDGTMAMCCNDWRGVMAVGSIHQSNIEELWHHPIMRAARRKLYYGKRDFAPCLGCDFTSYRIGLLPDPLGKHTVPRPLKDDHELLIQAGQKGPLTNPVWRPWEEQYGSKR